MKYIFFTLFGSIVSFITSQNTFAQDGGITGLSKEKLRNGDIHINDIPAVITNAINYGMGIAGTVAVLFVIVWAYKLLFGSLSQDKTKGKDTIIMAIFGFVIASLAWFIIRIIIDNI